MTSPAPKTVTIMVPTYEESASIAECLNSIMRQTYPHITEILVIDGRSTDETRAIAAQYGKVRIVDNPARIQAVALNLGLAEAQGDIVVRVDGHCALSDDYVERCVNSLLETEAAIVGGAMTPRADTVAQRGIADAMASRFGAGPARFHIGGEAGWVDTVYLGAYRRRDAVAIGGYSTDVGVNEDAEFALRMRRHRGGVWFDPAIRSVYRPRKSLPAVSKQFFRYGLSRAATVRRHPSAIRPRQLAAPAVVLALTCIPKRRPLMAAYAAGVTIASALDGRGGFARRGVFAGALPTMHLSWGLGFILGMLGVPPPKPLPYVTPNTTPRSST